MFLILAGGRAAKRRGCLLYPWSGIWMWCPYDIRALDYGDRWLGQPFVEASRIRKAIPANIVDVGMAHTAGHARSPLALACRPLRQDPHMIYSPISENAMIVLGSSDRRKFWI